MEKVKYYRISDTDIILTETYEDSPLTKCPLCKSGVVGNVKYTTSRDSREGVHEMVLGVPAVLLGSICSICESKFKRNDLPKKKTTEEAAHDRDYAKFVKGDLYPEIKVTHIRADKTCEATARLKDSTRFYK